jgi:hypothetical protein
MLFKCQYLNNISDVYVQKVHKATFAAAYVFICGLFNQTISNTEYKALHISNE